MAAKIATAAIAEVAAGAAIRRKMRHSEAPSMRAASRSSSGSAVRKYWRMMKTPKLITRYGAASPGYVLIQCQSRMVRYSGTMYVSSGRIAVARNSIKIAVSPGKRNFPKTYPATVEVATITAVETAATTRLFRKNRANGAVANARA